MTPVRRIAVMALLTASIAGPVLAQAPGVGRVEVTVIDQTGAVIPSASVTISGEEDATRAAAHPPALTSGTGVAALEGLRPGRYTLVAEFTGFETTVVKDVRIRAGLNRQRIVLPISKVEAAVTVGRDAQQAAADARGRSFGTEVAREQVDGLSDDATEAEKQLQQLAGGNALIRVDGFEGAPIPPRSQIQSIHINRDPFAAENHFAGRTVVDIVRQPGTGALNGGYRYVLRDGSLTGRSPFVAKRGYERSQNSIGNIGGTLIKNKTSYQIFFGAQRAFETANLNVALPNGIQSNALALRTPHDFTVVQGLFDHALTRNHALRVAFGRFEQSDRNMGIGQYDLPERAYNNDRTQFFMQVRHVGPIGRRTFLNTRFAVSGGTQTQASAAEAPTIRVLEAFTAGGQQLSGKRVARTVSFGFDIDHVRGIHSIRVGANDLNFGFAKSTLQSNYLGTYTFESLAAYEAGRPRSFTRRVGDPTIDYYQGQSGVYVQDDMRVRKNLTLSPGLRVDLQARPHWTPRPGPRFGATWAPFASGRTTIRGSAGIFYDFLDSPSFEQFKRLDGFHQQELTILNPAYPDVGALDVLPPATRYFVDSAYTLPRATRLSLGVEQQLFPKLRTGVQFTSIRTAHALRGQNLNAPVNGVRPDPAFANLVEMVNDAASRGQTLEFTYTIGAPGPGSLPASSPRVDWRRVYVNGSYTWGRFRNNTDGDFAVTPTGTLATEWGPGLTDIRHRGLVSLNGQVLKNLTTNATVLTQSGAPYTLLTGLDTNGDQIFNDRPLGVGRNTLRAAGQFSLNVNTTYSLNIGKRSGPAPPPDPFGNPNQPVGSAVRVQFFMNAQNLTNHANYGGYSSVVTSPFFRQPTFVLNPRRIDVGVNLGF